MASIPIANQGSGLSTSSIFDTHPDYQDKAPDWVLMFDAYKGNRRIKERNTTYLPTTGGMRALGLGSGANGQPKEGQALYNAYLTRARYPDWVRSTIVKLIGLITREDAVIEVPTRLEPLIEHATPEGESLQVLLRKIYENQLRMGRFGILVDVDASRNLPYFATYEALAVANWDDTLRREGADMARELTFVLLDESRYSRDAAEAADAKNRVWNWQQRARILTLQGTTYAVELEVDKSSKGVITPSIQGKTFNRIPFVFVNPMDLLPDPDEPPLVGLAEIALQAYRTDADYRQALFNQGQDTLVILGATLPQTDPRDAGAGEKTTADQIVGAGAVIAIQDPNGDAKFIGVEGQGLSELRQALQDSKAEAGEYGGELLSAAGGGESGEALNTRIGARTANLPGIVKTGAKALEQVLRMAAEWVGADPDQVKVEPNMDFVDDPMTGEEAAQWIGAKRLGFPIALRTIHEMAQKRDATGRTFEEELEEIEREETTLPDSMRGGGGSGDPGAGAGEPGGEEEEGDDTQGGGNRE